MSSSLFLALFQLNVSLRLVSNSYSKIPKVQFLFDISNKENQTKQSTDFKDKLFCNKSYTCSLLTHVSLEIELAQPLLWFDYGTCFSVSAVDLKDYNKINGFHQKFRRKKKKDSEVRLFRGSGPESKLSSVAQIL